MRVTRRLPSQPVEPEAGSQQRPENVAPVCAAARHAVCRATAPLRGRTSPRSRGCRVRSAGRRSGRADRAATRLRAGGRPPSAARPLGERRLRAGVAEAACPLVQRELPAGTLAANSASSRFRYGVRISSETSMPARSALNRTSSGSQWRWSSSITRRRPSRWRRACARADRSETEAVDLRTEGRPVQRVAGPAPAGADPVEMALESRPGRHQVDRSPRTTARRRRGGEAASRGGWRRPAGERLRRAPQPAVAG